MTPRERGTTRVADRVVRKVAEQAAREAVTDSGGSVTKGSASVAGHSAEVSVGIALAYQGSAGPAAHTVQDHVSARTSHLTGLCVPTPRILVQALTTSASVPALPDTGVLASEGSRRRRWSERRLPVGMLAALALASAAALLQDEAAVHLQGRRPAPWRRQLLDWLTEHGPASTPAWAAAVLAVAGLWMVTLALTPGRRSDLVLSTPGHGVRAVLNRRSAAQLIRAALRQVPGITAARVRMGRRRLTVRAELAYGEPAEALEQVRQAVAAAAREMTLAVPPRTHLRVRPIPAWQPAPTPHEEGDVDGPHP